jgi:hypothetical protein
MRSGFVSSPAISAAGMRKNGVNRICGNRRRQYWQRHMDAQPRARPKALPCGRECLTNMHMRRRTLFQEPSVHPPISAFIQSAALFLGKTGAGLKNFLFSNQKNQPSKHYLHNLRNRKFRK